MHKYYNYTVNQKTDTEQLRPLTRTFRSINT